jgi:hypothetical protein
MRACGEEEVAHVLSRDTCSPVVAVIRSDGCLACEIVPRKQQLQREGDACYLWTSSSEAFVGPRPDAYSKHLGRPNLLAAAASCATWSPGLVIALVAGKCPPRGRTKRWTCARLQK